MVFKSNLKKGFTLMELLVVISIISITAAILVINQDTSTSDVNLLNAKSALITNINKAKEMALSGVGANVGDEYYGIGIWFPNANGTEYYIYRNKDTDFKYSSADEILEKVVLPKGIKYARSNQCSGVLFSPPTPVVNIINCSPSQTFKVNILKESGGTAHTVTVNKSGLVE